VYIKYISNFVGENNRSGVIRMETWKWQVGSNTHTKVSIQETKEHWKRKNIGSKL